MGNVVFLSTGLGFGGTSVVVSVAKRLAERGWNITFLVAVLPKNQKKIEELAQSGIQVVSLKMNSGSIPVLGFLRLVLLLKKWKPDLLHSHSVHANLFGRLAGLFVKIPVVLSTAHNVYEGSRWREIGYRVTDGLADMTTQVSQAGADRYVAIKAVPKHKMLVIPNGVDVERFRKRSEFRLHGRKELCVVNEFLWLAIGRFTEQKNFPLMLRAFRRVIEKRQDSSLAIVGDGPLFKRMKRFAIALGLEENVLFLGLRNDVATMMNAADGFVMSSAWEGMPMVLIEAAACELPIVATNVGGVSEVFDDGAGGYLVPSGDEAGLGDAMLRMMSLSEEDRGQLGKSARARVVERFDMESIVDRWDSLYGQLLRKNRSR